MRMKSLLNFIEDVLKMSKKFTINFKSVLIYFVNDFETSKNLVVQLMFSPAS